MRLVTVMTLLSLAVACSVPNRNHCANNEGHAFCAARDPKTPYCSTCLADNNGCVASPVGSTCDAGSTSVAEATTTSPSTSTAGQTTSSSTSDPTTSGASTSGPQTTDLTTSSSTSLATTGTTTTETTPETTDTTSGSTAETTGTSDGTTMDGPMCGDNMQEDPEICDGSDLNGLNCVLKDPQKFSGGTLSCVACSSYDDTDCCLAAGQKCDGIHPCCPGTSCQLLCNGLSCCKP